MVENLLANVGDTRDLLDPRVEEDMATHSSILAWKTPWIEEPGGLLSMGSESDTTEAT